MQTHIPPQPRPGSEDREAASSVIYQLREERAGQSYGDQKESRYTHKTESITMRVLEDLKV